MAGNQNPWRDILTPAEWQTLEGLAGRSLPRPPVPVPAAAAGGWAPQPTLVQAFTRIEALIQSYDQIPKDDHTRFNALGEKGPLCLLVMIGARPDGEKELVAVSSAYRESTESWAELLRDPKRCGMEAPVVAVGDGALGFWAPLRDVWPETAEQRDWVHKMANVRLASGEHAAEAVPAVQAEAARSGSGGWGWTAFRYVGASAR